jgi:predicted signal transduction protein with EAL and GGDEF domain
MRMDVVAEGVENFEQVMYLRELGIRSAQGYVFAPPLPGKAFLQLVEAMDTLLATAASKAALAGAEPKAELADAQVSAQASAQVSAA